MSSSASSAVRENASGVLYDLLTAAAGAGLLEKAVFSKCRDRAVVRIVLTLRLVRNNVVLQAETFRQAEVAAVSGKTKPVQAGQENLPLDSPSGQTRDRLTGLIAACDQINRLLELIRDTESALPATGCLHICDLCCGKSYLSFAVYHYFTAIRHRELHMVGVEMNRSIWSSRSTPATRQLTLCWEKP